ncbi:MAG: hypothetical protein KIT43_10335 [Bauldia sp.]|nr:hypothetical protein [Bauldia sp.]
MAAGSYPGAGFRRTRVERRGRSPEAPRPRPRQCPSAPARWPAAGDPRQAAALAAARGQEPSSDGAAHGRPPIGPDGFAPAPAARGASPEGAPGAAWFDPTLRRASDAAAQRHTALARAYAAKQDHARAELPDYDRVVGAARMPVSHALAEALVESEHTARLEYHLARSPEKLAELNRLSPREAARAVGRLETAIAGAAAPRPTRAPAPLAPLRGGAAGPMRSLAELATSENAADYIELRRAQRRA